MFRFSGLAHLLAISGLHMGLLCFGVIGFLRGVMALMPGVASRLPVHKFAAFAGLLAAALYVVLSGASISASRAFLMAVLIILAILSDRLALTLRNVAIAALVLLAFNPLALFTAGFQMSFAATAALVIRFENYAGAPRGGWRLWRWFRELVIASVIASLATLPFTAQHFGLVTPWGVIANLIGIPLTGLWIMPAGLTVLATQLLPVPQMIADACLWVIQLGIGWLVAAANWFFRTALYADCLATARFRLAVCGVCPDLLLPCGGPQRQGHITGQHARRCGCGRFGDGCFLGHAARARCGVVRTNDITACHRSRYGGQDRP
jgi:competence protein ComEC